MGQTLSNFLIGIGIDNQTTKGAREVTSALDSIKRSSLQAGLAVGAMTGGLSVMAGNTAKNIRSFSQFAEQIGASTELVAAQSEAWQRAGGSASGYMSLLERLAKMRAGVLKGDVSWIGEAAKVGLNYNDMLNTAPDELLPKIIGRMSKMNQQQRLNAVDALAAEPVLSNIAVDGRGAFEERTEKQLERFQITKQMESESERLLTNWSDTLSEMEAITDRASVAITPKLNEITGSINEFFRSNREGINSGIDMVFGKVAENLELVAIAAVSLSAAGIGGTLSGMARSLPIIGGTAGAIGAVAKNLGLVGVAATVAAGGARLIDGQLQGFNWYNDLDAKFTGWLYDTFGVDVSRGQVYSNQPTVIEPGRVAQLETAREATRATTYHQAMAAYQPNIGGYSPTIKAQHNITIDLNGRHLQNFVLETVDQANEQTVRDLRSPIER